MGLASRLVALSDRAILRVAGLAVDSCAENTNSRDFFWVVASKLQPTNPLKRELRLQADLAWPSAAVGLLLL